MIRYALLPALTDRITASARGVAIGAPLVSQPQLNLTTLINGPIKGLLLQQKDDHCPSSLLLHSIALLEESEFRMGRTNYVRASLSALPPVLFFFIPLPFQPYLGLMKFRMGRVSS